MFNASSQSVRRLQSEFRALAIRPEPYFVAGPVGDDLFLWHFTIKGAKDTPFEGGIYHGKIVFPPQYPLKPPDIYFLTPNGRFETRTKLCLTFTSFHPEEWNPAWDVRTAMTAVQAFMTTKAEGAVGAIDMPDADRRRLAIESRSWKCSQCEYHIDPDPIPGDGDHQNEEEKPQLEEEDKVEVQEEPEDADVKPEEEEEKAEPEAKEGEETEQGQEEVNVEPADDCVHYNFEELEGSPAKKGSAFMPILDIPIVILFLLLLFLIANNTFHFVEINPLV